MVASPSSESGLTILHVLSWLNYGGVESYAIRLSRALRERGHRVLIASSGGQMLPELEASGIEHFQVDFTGARLLPGLVRLRRLLEEQHVDLVNAHNWRAGMVSYLACRRAGVPYLLTVHGTRRPLHRRGVFYWSKRVMVVSEASRRNLVEGFRLPADRIVVSRIGVDCRQFREQPADEELERKLGLRPGAPRVVHISRFSHGKAPVAISLIACMSLLEQAAPNVELVLAGQGPEEGAISHQAEEMNQRLGRRAVIALGGRPDVPRLLSLASVVVATATVAMEAMASGKPVIAAGKGGYLGPVTPETLGQAEASCFADHEELSALSRDSLAADLGRLLGNPAELARLGAFGRQVAVSRHSVARVAEEVEGVYHQALCQRDRVKRIVVFHLNQIGDLMFSLPALKALREAFPAAHITSVLRPHLAGLVSYSGLVDEIAHRPPGGPWPAIGLGLALRRQRPDLAITFSQSATMALCAWLSGAPHRLGYVDSDLCRLLNHRVQVRGIPCPAKVLRLVKSLGLAPAKADYVGMIRLSPEDLAGGRELLDGCELWGAGPSGPRGGAEGSPRGPLIALAPGEAADRQCKGWHVTRFAETARRLSSAYAARLLVVGGPADRMAGEQMISGLEGQACNLAGRTTPAQLAAVLAQCDLLIGIDSGPMHVAAAMGRPVVGLFGPSDPGRTGPMGEGHEVIFHRQDCWQPCVHPVVPNCTERKCMEAITVEDVLAAAERIIERLSNEEAPGGGGAVHDTR